MTLYQVSMLLLDLLPVLTVLAVFIGEWLAQRLPARQREALRHFAETAVSATEQVFGGTEGASKKQMALQLVEELFRAFKLPIPNATAIDAAIEAAVWALTATQGPQSQNTQNVQSQAVQSSSVPFAGNAAHPGV
jgi:LL-H family phage holin